MERYRVRNLRDDDFDALMALEERLFGGCEEGVLGPYYVRICCDLFHDTCFVVEADGAPVGYLLAFVRGDEACCTTLAVLPEHQGTRALVALLAAFVGEVAERVQSCWFTVEEGNRAARSVHRILGAREERVEPNFYGPGRARIISRIDRSGFTRAIPRLARLGILGAEPRRTTAPGVEAFA